ncbi:hypothetical protein CTI12_AA604180 [Artemisia annua]|uniref:Reverse transcriptase zinc-binding domain-containing protein n=1 Tax=Artemisia annua TaxID=35608 RepID=A0A2U1KGW4_ARTAN|nr:hypothetical protein CTI12_AA604180 [Artemisia annua]
MGVSDQTTLGEVMERNKKRRHRNALLNQVEHEILMLKEQRVHGQVDEFLWRQNDNTYSDRFRSKPYLGLSSRYLVTWLATKNRLATGERMECWNTNVHIGCSFCAELKETWEHLFFDCLYSRKIWEALVGGLMGSDYTWEWTNILNQISLNARIDMSLFIVRYAFQATIHSLWIERNRRRHGEKSITNTILVRIIDVMVRNMLSTMRRSDVKKFEDGIRIWFGTRKLL